MTHTAKRGILAILAAMLLMMVWMAVGYAEEGTYEGEYDANGKRSGYGTWAYHNYLYVGNWKNDLPNGEGTLYRHFVATDSDGQRFLEKSIVQGNWVDGFANGPIEESNVGNSGIVITYRYDVKDGCIASDEAVVLINGNENEPISLDIGRLVAAVPPWSPILPDSTLPTPLPTFEYDDDAEALAGITQPMPSEIDDDGGIYEGEYDLGGKRSGHGTWAYHNFLFVGHWENDLPNGEGTLYYRSKYKYDEKSHFVEILHGNWVNGYPNGAIEWSLFSDGDPLPNTYRVNGVKKGVVNGTQYAPSINMRRFYHFGESFEELGRVAPWGMSARYEVDSAVGTPWDLYEKYPLGRVEQTLPKIENTGMGISPGNLGNGMHDVNNGFVVGYGSPIRIAALGDWIFLCAESEKADTVYKMSADGTRFLKLAEHKNNKDSVSWNPLLQVVGDWLYVAEDSKIQADDFEFVTAENDWFGNLVIDEWEYIPYARYGSQSGTYTKHLLRANLDYTEIEDLGSYDKYDEYCFIGVISADKNWVYLYYGNEGGPQELIKMKTDGSEEVERHPLGKTVSDLIANPGQIVGGRLYYTDVQVHGGGQNIEDYEKLLLSVDLDFMSAPVTVARQQENHSILTFHVTDDFIYYSEWNIVDHYQRGQKETSSIIRVDHDGGNLTVLSDEIEGLANNILIAGDWMMFRVFMTPYLMRLDGSDLHKLGDPFVPSNAPGITDSTGNWRYELLEDGSAVILGPGSKLKQTGKLSIPATVDKIPVTAIGANAFYGCEGFTGVTIPKSVTSIGDFAFFWCKGLTGVTIPEGVTHIGEGAFQWCTKIKKVTLPASLTSVGSGAFANCPTVKLTVAKKNETFEIVDGALFDKLQNKFVD